MKKAVAIFLILLPALALAAISDEDAKNLYEKKCVFCHDRDRSASASKSPEGWRKTVLRMMNDNGCSITDEEAEAIIGHLIKTFPKK